MIWKNICHYIFFLFYEKIDTSNVSIIKKYIFFTQTIMATSKTWTHTLDPDSGPGPRTLDPDLGPWNRTLDPDPEKRGKQLEMEK